MARVVVAIILTVLLSWQSADAHSARKKKITPSRKEKVVAMAGSFERPLRGWNGRVQYENLLASKFDLPQIEDQKMLDKFADEGRVVRVRESGTFLIDLRSDPRRRYLIPQALYFLNIIAEEFIREFGVPFKLTSFARPIDYHVRDVIGRQHASSAFCRTEDDCTLHSRANAFDISRKGLSEKQLKWLRERLVYYYERTHGSVRPTEEKDPKLNNFHVVVYPNFALVQK